MVKKKNSKSKNLVAPITIYIISILITIYSFTVDNGNRNWFQVITAVVIPSLSLMYIAYLLRPAVDKLATVLYVLLTLVGIAVISTVVGYILLVLSFGIA